MIVHHIDLAEGGAHLSHLSDEAAGQSGKGDVTLFEVDAFFAERDEEVSAGVRINDRLEAHFRFVHLECRRGLQGDGTLLGIAAQCADEISDDTDIGIERFRGSSSGATQVWALSGRGQGRGLGFGLRLRGSCGGWNFGLCVRLGCPGGSCSVLHRRRGLRGRSFQHADLPFECDDAIFQFTHFLFQGGVIGTSCGSWRGLLRPQGKS